MIFQLLILVKIDANGLQLPEGRDFEDEINLKN
jgi:hypothetical protein